MTSIRNEADRVLDAARDCILDFGVRRTTLTAIAQRARISRPTLYRRFPDLPSIIRALVTREIVELLPHDLGPGPVADALIDALVATAARVRHDPLVTRIVELDPELLVPYVFERLGSSQQTMLDMLRRMIDAGQADGSIRPGDPAAMAAMVLLLLQASVQSARVVRGPLPPDVLDAELRAMLRGYLVADHG